MLYDYQIIKNALTEYIESFNSIGYCDELFTIETDYGNFEMYEIFTYIFALDELYYNNDTGNENDTHLKLNDATLADCITYLNKLYNEYLEDQEHIEAEKGL